MTEEFLQFIWKNRLFKNENLYSIDGHKIEILNTGYLNNDQGPDFFNAKIKIDNQIWFGNVEIHLKSSDWYKHNHHKDPNYNNVILHAVLEHDKDVYNSKGIKIPSIELKFDKKYYDNYVKLLINSSAIACSNFIKKINKIEIYNWIERAEIERLERKTLEIISLIKKYKNDWNEVFYIFLAKNFGFKKNALPFEMLAKSLNSKIIQKHKDNLQQIEALLFGVSGLLTNNDCDYDDYVKQLKNEFNFLKNKFNLKEIDVNLWIFLRLRPANFPTIRIAQLAQILHKTEFLFSQILEKEIDEIKEFFDVETSKYWKNHYNFCKKSKNSRTKRLGKTAIDNIMINTVANFVFAYGYYFNDEKLKEKAIKILENIKAENNSIVKKWSSANITAKNAFESQGLIEIYNNYCKKGNCLNCGIGKKIIIKI